MKLFIKKKHLPKIFILFFPAYAAAEKYWFDPALFQGSSYGQNLEQFNSNEDTIPAGNYLVDIWVNGSPIMTGEKVAFMKADTHDAKTEPCLAYKIISAARIKTSHSAEKGCRTLHQWLPEASWSFDRADLRLNLTVPNKFVEHIPQGTIPMSEWESGTSALFLRHNTSFTFTQNTQNKYNYSYLWSGIHSGFNAGLWQVRHQGNLRYMENNVNGGSYRYNRVRSWVQRPLPGVESTLMFGEGYTDSGLFGSLAFKGLKLSTDERMRPESRRGYAPVVRGIAGGAARIMIRQQGKVIYEVNVSPGPFLINDLNNTQNQGDLEVEIIEVNGKTSRFTVPYSAVPDSVRPGNWSYSLAMGRVRQYDSVENSFFEGGLQRGISNNLTANFGSRIADDYMAWLTGGVLATRAGAIGLNTTWSQSRIAEGHTEQGWRTELSYSKTFISRTNLVLAAYRYSTNGFRDLQDVLGARRQLRDSVAYYSDTLHQRNRLSATVSQPLDELGTLNLAASTADYHNNQSRITQLQLGYSNAWQKLSYSVNIARQRTTWERSRFDFDAYDESSREKYTENTVSLNFSLPLDWGESRSSVAFNATQSREMRSATTSLTGSAGKDNNLSWSLYGGYDDFRSQSGNASTWGMSAQKHTRLGALRGSWDQGENYRQLGMGTSGTFVAHRGGITAGPYASETFALVKAEGAEGAAVSNGMGAVISRSGYAIIPSLTPYRNNTISLDSRNMNPDAELKGGSRRIVPYAGAIAEIHFDTLKGKATLINLKTDGDSMPPMGANVSDASGTQIGMVGQGGQLYARLLNQSGILRVSWGDKQTQNCFVRYQLPVKSDTPVIQLTQRCEKE